MKSHDLRKKKDRSIDFFHYKTSLFDNNIPKFGLSYLKSVFKNKTI